MSGRGSVFTYTVNYHPFNPGVPPPYVIAIVELVEQVGLRFTTNIVDCAVDEVSIGMAVEVTFEQAGDTWVPVFRPAPGGPAVGPQAVGGER
ncbi:MAG: OB-fold domain-containing protein [Acidimicrobiales bacterium]